MTQQPPAGRAAQEQFGRQAHLYANSPTHRDGDGLDALAEYLGAGNSYQLIVDVGTGAGFTAFAAAPFARYVLATDITPQMLAQTRKLAAQRGLTNVGALLAQAESLPLRDASVDAVTCRLAAHHFHDLPRFVAEAHRVLKPGGLFLFTDTIAPEADYDDRWLNDVEVLRDPTHVRDLKASQWLALAAAVGFAVTHAARGRVYNEFNDWVGRAATPAQNIALLQALFRDARPSVRDAFGISTEGASYRYSWEVLMARAVKK